MTQAEAFDENVLSGVERRERLHTTIDSLLRSRQQVIVSYCQLAGVNSFEQRDVDEDLVEVEELNRFCEILVDYTAMGHFEIYQRIREGKERRRAVKEAAAQVYDEIAMTTDYLVDFNDKYDDFSGTPEEIEMLMGDLSKLGEMLTLRAEREDCILAALRA